MFVGFTFGPSFFFPDLLGALANTSFTIFVWHDVLPVRWPSGTQRTIRPTVRFCLFCDRQPTQKPLKNHPLRRTDHAFERLGLNASFCSWSILVKALAWHGKGDIRCEEVPDPKIEHPRDAVIKVTACAICGSDLHIYGGIMPQMKSGDVLGHENMGEVVEVGSENKKLKVSLCNL